MVVASADIVNRAFGETPMRASPADCKSALRLGGALCLPKSTWLHGGGYCGYCKSCFWGDAHAGVSCRLQVGAPPGRRSVLILPFTCPSPWLPAECKLVLFGRLASSSPAECKLVILVLPGAIGFIRCLY